VIIKLKDLDTCDEQSAQFLNVKSGGVYSQRCAFGRVSAEL